jgi:hypothetical protein
MVEGRRPAEGNTDRPTNTGNLGVETVHSVGAESWSGEGPVG